MTDDSAYPQDQRAPEPNPDLRALDRLVGTWNVAGGATGQVTYEWMEGRFFLVQHVDLEQYGQRLKGIEIIGHEKPFGAEPGPDLKSRHEHELTSDNDQDQGRMLTDCSRAAEDGGADLLGRVLLHPGHDVAVDVQGDADAGMTEILRHDLDVDTGQQRQRGVGVAQVVETDPR
jgi:hypothetical protein